MNTGILSAFLVLELDDGRTVQRPLNKVEVSIVVPMLQGHDGNTLRVFPYEKPTLH